MRSHRTLFVFTIAAAYWAFPSPVVAAEDTLFIGSPDAPITAIGPHGTVHEDWGDVQLRLDGVMSEDVQRTLRMAPGPTVSTLCSTSTVTLRTDAFRSPTWPRPVDVVVATVSNTSDAATTAELSLVIPEHVEMGEQTGSVGGRKVIRLPEGVRPQRGKRQWGWIAGGDAMAGWGKPGSACDPAFRNIRAGMGGVPLIYEFAVPARGGRKVALGFCESHWAEAGQRPVIVAVEGAPVEKIDPIKLWGQHDPGCLVYNGKDANGDGFLQVKIDPVQSAPDRNTILNVIWVFGPDAQVDPAAAIAGRLNDAAEHYVDVGGEADQSLYEPGDLHYELPLEAGETQTLCFQLAPKEGAVTSPDSAWDVEKLKKAARDVWGDWFARSALVSIPSAQKLTECRYAVALIVMCRAQANGYYVAQQPGGSASAYSPVFACHAIRALDVYGFNAEAERLLRVYWDKPAPAPQPFQHLSQTDSGQWEVQSGCVDTHNLVLLAVAQHAQLTRDIEWAKRVLPAVAAGAEWTMEDHSATGDPALRAQALDAAAELMRMAGVDAAEVSQKAPALFDSNGLWRPDRGKTGIVGTAISLRNALVREHRDDLVLLGDAAPEWFLGSGIHIDRLPTKFGPISTKAVVAGSRLHVRVDLPAHLVRDSVALRIPPIDGQRPAEVSVFEETIPVDAHGWVRADVTDDWVMLRAAYP